MEVPKKSIDQNSDELDPLNLVEKAVSFFRNFGRLIIICSVIGLLLGWVMFKILPRQYASRLILHSVILTNQEEIEIIETWKSLLNKGEHATLARVMDLDISVIKKLSKISAEEIQKLYIQNNPNGFIVDVLVKDTSILGQLQKGIVTGLENSDYVKERVAIRKDHLIQLIRQVQSEIGKLDTTKSSVQNIISNKSAGASSLMVDISGINTQWVELNEKVLRYEEDLKFVNAVQVLQSFNKLSKPEKPKLATSLFFGLVAGAFIGYILAMIAYLRRKLKLRAATRLQAA
jgi:hypothetical protein